MTLNVMLILAAVVLCALWRRAVSDHDVARGELIAVRTGLMGQAAEIQRARRVLDLAARVYLTAPVDEELRVDGAQLMEASDALDELEGVVIEHLQARGDITEERVAELREMQDERRRQAETWAEPPRATPIEDLLWLKDWAGARSYGYGAERPGAADCDFPEVLHDKGEG